MELARFWVIIGCYVLASPVQIWTDLLFSHVTNCRLYRIIRPPLPGSCSAYAGVNLGDLHFDGARLATSGVSGSDVVVGRIVVPSGWAGKAASIAIYEYDDPQYAKKAYLSKSPCDFTTVWPAYNEGNSMSLMVSFETSMSNAVRMNAGEFWYLTVKNERLSGAPSCVSGSSCNFAITMSVPSF